MQNLTACVLYERAYEDTTFPLMYPPVDVVPSKVTVCSVHVVRHLCATAKPVTAAPEVQRICARVLTH
jgi:hypothetical protein